MRMLLLVAGMAVLSGKILAADAVQMSASDIIKKSDAAYAAVKTCVGTTTRRVNTDTGGLKIEQVSTAKVTFMRPGKLRIEGTIGGLGQGRPFAIVTDGKKTWKSFAIQNNGAFTEVQSLAIAGASVLSLGLAEGMPAALMKSDGAPGITHFDPFMVARTSAVTLAGHETIDGADCYKLAAKHLQQGDVTLWIDSKSFLLRQMTREHSEAQMAAARRKAEEAMQKIGKVLPARSAPKATTEFFAFTIDQVDGAVDAKLFIDPTKM